jgi:AcrR family transcriptional regulator
VSKRDEQTVAPGRAPRVARPGGRSARVRAAVLSATLEELALRGYDGLSMEAVATRAGVHKTTVYRRWGDRAPLVLDAMLELSSQTVPVPDTGTLRGDLRALARSIATNLSSPQVTAVLRALVAAGREPRIAAAVTRYWRARFDLVAQVVQRGVERGELPASASSDLIIEALIGPLYLRALVTDEVLDEAFVDATVDLVLAGARGLMS